MLGRGVALASMPRKAPVDGMDQQTPRIDIFLSSFSIWHITLPDVPKLSSSLSLSLSLSFMAHGDYRYTTCIAEPQNSTRLDGTSGESTSPRAATSFDRELLLSTNKYFPNRQINLVPLLQTREEFSFPRRGPSPILPGCQVAVLNERTSPRHL